MSFHVFFGFSTGISKTMNVPKGTYQRMMDHVAWVEQELGIERETYNGEVRWNHWPLIKKELKDEKLCSVVEKHNSEIRYFYRILCEAKDKPASVKTEKLTPKKAAKFWLGLDQISVEPEQWSNDYYRARMDAMYEALRGREAEGMTYDAEPLTERQAADVIILFSQWLDRGDIRLDVIKGHDQLSSSYDGGHDWCANCGAIEPECIYLDECPEGYDESFCIECNAKKGFVITPEGETGEGS